ncbi:hypothetical protein GH714_000050 [Hevea brasiliensis]|uniref:DUF659 domain-containing protein n=1 Tax=Hevea brasiliensis TaxID=3981 RepID=A0A6A6M721_HEVBR|nr:hypothetical protein GH714_000050 [Hevea brasiliensis]
MSNNSNSNAIGLTSPIDQACSIAFLSTQDSSTSPFMDVMRQIRTKTKMSLRQNEGEENPFASKKRKRTSKHTFNFCDVPPPHTGVIICDVLQKCLVEWGIEDKVWTVSVDNAAYNDATIRMLKDNLA